MFITFNKLKGEVLFNSDDFSFLKITDSPVADTSFVDGLKDVFSVDRFNVSQSFASRYSNIIMLYKDSPKIDEANIAKIEEEALSSGFGSDLQFVSQILRCHKNRESNTVNTESLFTCMRKEPDGTVSILGEVLKLNITDKSFGMRLVDKKKNDDENEELKTIYFINEFEVINVNKNDLPNKIHAIENRMNMPGRVAKHYTVIKCPNDVKNAINCRKFDQMKIDDMLVFFGHLKKCQTKIETLSECLRSWSTKYLPPSNVNVNNNYFIEISDRNNFASPFNVLPVDWILSNASRLRIICSEAPNKNTTHLMVQVVEKPVDDFAQMLYTSLDSHQSVCLVGITSEIMKKTIDSYKASLRQK